MIAGHLSWKLKGITEHIRGQDRPWVCTQIVTMVQPNAQELRTLDTVNLAWALRSVELVISRRYECMYLWRFWASTLSTWWHQAMFWKIICVTAHFIKSVRQIRRQKYWLETATQALSAYHKVIKICSSVLQMF